jgi:predicted dienelactone hydrolase
MGKTGIVRRPFIMTVSPKSRSARPKTGSRTPDFENCSTKASVQTHRLKEHDMKLTTLTAALMISSTAANADGAGLRHYEFDAPHHGRTVTATLWYPSQSGGELTMTAENAVFYGTEARLDGDLDQGGRLPLVLMSHGLGGNWRSSAWLTAGLAETGAIVISLDHPNSTSFDFNMREGLNHWTRAQDLTQALDLIMADQEFADRIDTSRIMAAGFSYGGWTALSLGGLKGNLKGEIAECELQGEASSHCADLARAGIGFGNLDEALWNASYRDARITHVAAIDPALHHGMDDSHTANLIENILMIGLGDGEDRLVATNFDASGFAALLPQANIERIVPAYHFAMLPECKPAGPAILKEENDDPVCTDPEGANRADIHAQIFDMIRAELGL